MKTKFRSKGKMSISNISSSWHADDSPGSYKSIFVDMLRVGTNMATWINEHGLDTVTALETDRGTVRCWCAAAVLVQMSTNVGPSLAALA